MAQEYMRTSGTAIREMLSLSARPADGTGHRQAVAKDEAHVAFATAATAISLYRHVSGSRVQVGERLSLRFHQGRVSIDGVGSREMT